MDKKWLIIGAVGVGGVALIYFSSKSSAMMPNQTISPTAPASLLNSLPTSSVGNMGGNNGSLLGYVDPTTGVTWLLEAVNGIDPNTGMTTNSEQWVATLPAGITPPNYTPGSAYIPGSPQAPTPAGA